MEIKMETFHQVVTPLLQDDFLEVRLSAVMALAQLPSAVQKHLEALGALIIDPDTVLREQALMALTHAGDGASVYQDQVAVLLADPSTGVRHAAMRVLGAMGKPLQWLLPKSLGWARREVKKRCGMPWMLLGAWANRPNRPYLF